MARNILCVWGPYSTENVIPRMHAFSMLFLRTFSVSIRLSGYSDKYDEFTGSKHAYDRARIGPFFHV